ncbi:hypothetical protein Pcinc_043383 [Petrolisthes cinctipes]|uniref:Uncharacterized protein n=1 Tax=Petrolisthes cinctipes TaxID=88211 RepID=A0AAE1BFQ4_PETCI|nr:hypothetical protein Pcinc_043383 [Petrolisthes cinctipes]
MRVEVAVEMRPEGEINRMVETGGGNGVVIELRAVLWPLRTDGRSVGRAGRRAGGGRGWSPPSPYMMCDPSAPGIKLSHELPSLVTFRPLTQLTIPNLFPSLIPSFHPPRPNTLPFPTHPPLQPLTTHYLILPIHPTNPLQPITPSYPSSHLLIHPTNLLLPITPSYPSSHPTHPPHQPLLAPDSIIPIPPPRPIIHLWGNEHSATVEFFTTYTLPLFVD